MDTNSYFSPLLDCLATLSCPSSDYHNASLRIKKSFGISWTFPLSHTTLYNDLFYHRSCLDADWVNSWVREFQNTDEQKPQHAVRGCCISEAAVYLLKHKEEVPTICDCYRSYGTFWCLAFCPSVPFLFG